MKIGFTAGSLYSGLAFDGSKASPIAPDPVALVATPTKTEATVEVATGTVLGAPSVEKPKGEFSIQVDTSFSG